MVEYYILLGWEMHGTYGDERCMGQFLVHGTVDLENKDFFLRD